MFKKSILAIIALIIIGINTMPVYGYAIENKYKPINAPGYQIDYEGSTSDTATGMTIVILRTLAGALLYFAAPIAVFSIAQSAFTMAMSGADTEKLEQSKKHLTWAILGLLTIILSFSIVKAIISSAVGIGNYAATEVQKQQPETEK